MAISTAVVTVGTGPTLLTSGREGDFVQAFVVYNDGTAIVYLGGPDVTTANGYPLKAGEPFAADLRNEHDELYAIVATGTQPVRVFGTEA